MGETWKWEPSENTIETGVVDKNRMRVRSNMKLEESWSERRSQRKVILSKNELMVYDNSVEIWEGWHHFLTSVWKRCEKVWLTKLIVAVELYDR